MKNKKLLLLLLILFIAIVIITIFITRNKKITNTDDISTNEIITDDTKIKKGYEIFGKDYCKGHSFFEPAGQAFTSWTCMICGSKGEHHNTATPTICYACSTATDRCSKCGKLLEK